MLNYEFLWFIRPPKYMLYSVFVDIDIIISLLLYTVQYYCICHTLEWKIHPCVYVCLHPLQSQPQVDWWHPVWMCAWSPSGGGSHRTTALNLWHIDGSPAGMTPRRLCLVPMNPITERHPLGISSQGASERSLNHVRTRFTVLAPAASLAPDLNLAMCRPRPCFSRGKN